MTKCKVFVLVYQKWEDTQIVGVFTTFELAQKRIDDCSKIYNRLNFEIIEEDLIGDIV